MSNNQKTKLQYNKISSNYSKVAESDPSKLFAQYYTVLHLLKPVVGKFILDIGCGQGIFSRLLAQNGARVVGYDISKTQIIEAKRQEKNNPLGIRYLVSTPRLFKHDEKFDAAVSIMVLPYALDKKDLSIFFKSTFEMLKNNGRFISVVFNPNFKRFNQIFYNRRWTKNKRGRIQVEFYIHNNRLITKAEYGYSFTKADYEYCAKESGFKKWEWNSLKIDKKGIKETGLEFWKDFTKDCPYVVFIVEK